MVKFVVSLEEFNALVAGSTGKLLVVDFTASWCGPCQMIAPTFETMAKENPDVTFIKVDVDEADVIASSVGVSAMPTFMFYKDGKKILEFAGANVTKLKDTVAKNK